MKKLLSVLLAVSMIFMLAIPCFAAKAAKFSVKKASETDSEIVVSVDYEGGSTFSCFDIEVTYNEKKLKVTEAYDGDGLDAFIRDAKKNEGAMVASVINKDNNPIKDSMAITASFKVVDGKDLLVVKFKKLSKDKITADDVKVVFTNCATQTEKVQASVSNLIGGGTAASQAPVTTSKAAQPTKNPEASTAPTDKTEKNSDTAVSEKTDDKSSEASSEAKTDAAEKSEITEAESEIAAESSQTETLSETEKPSNTKKIIAISAAAVCVLFVIAAVCIYISKKNKKEE